jgi:hypothetical protein
MAVFEQRRRRREAENKEHLRKLGTLAARSRRTRHPDDIDAVFKQYALMLKQWADAARPPQRSSPRLRQATIRDWENL